MPGVDPATGKEAPPHPRGSTLRAQGSRTEEAGSPASAGIDPSRTPFMTLPLRLPRIRGDRPIDAF